MVEVKEMTEQDRGVDLGLSGISLKRASKVIAGVLVAAVAVALVKQMSTEAMAVVIGVLCGVVAGIPASLLLLAAVTRGDRPRQDLVRRESARRDAPPVIVIQGGSTQSLPQGMQGGLWSGTAENPPVRRQFHVVGGDDLLMEGSDREGALWR